MQLLPKRVRFLWALSSRLLDCQRKCCRVLRNMVLASTIDSLAPATWDDGNIIKDSTPFFSCGQRHVDKRLQTGSRSSPDFKEAWRWRWDLHQTEYGKILESCTTSFLDPMKPTTKSSTSTSTASKDAEPSTHHEYTGTRCWTKKHSISIRVTDPMKEVD